MEAMSEEQKRTLYEALGKEINKPKEIAPKKPKEPKKTILVELISVGKTVSTHVFKRLSPNDLKKCDVNINDKTFTVTGEDFFLVKSVGFINRLKGVKHRFITFLDEAKGSAFLFSASPVSARNLLIVKQSTSLSRALKEMFTEAFAGKKLLFIAIAGIAIVVVAFIMYQKVMSGELSF